MVRPEGFEPPAYWFVANCSIQLSYGRTYGVASGAAITFLKITRGCAGVYSSDVLGGDLLDWSFGRSSRLRRDQRDFFSDIEAGAAQ
jgi:hypothetical protein